MSNVTEPMKSDPPANSNDPAMTPSEQPQTPEQVMQAAAARIAELETELAEMKDRWMRSEAETANVRARAHREVNETRQYAVQKFAQDIVEAAENLHRGLESLPAADNAEPPIVTRLREGLDGIERNFVNILERNGIKREDPTGTQFDPNLHQAMAEQESAAHQPGSVMHAWTPVWTLHGRLLKPAMVVVAKAPPGEISSSAANTRLDTTA
ncbi:MAG TPA: nucleotide exchange factor GrpE [Acetobacteraceae bacterium]|nr:nucleotide exchange factor GrpE [Acetobacteraceae bacterium]